LDCGELLTKGVLGGTRIPLKIGNKPKNEDKGGVGCGHLWEVGLDGSAELSRRGRKWESRLRFIGIRPQLLRISHQFDMDLRIPEQ
jgi:hypothetical protein